MSGALTLRGGFRRLSTGLLVYGMIGLVAAVIGLVGLLWISGRIGAAADRADATITELTATLERTSVVLTDAGATAQSFTGTIERTSAALDQTAAAVTNLQPQLEALETQFRSISILGNQPLAGAADLIGQIAVDTNDLDERLTVMSGSFLEDRDALQANADSLSALGTRIGSLADRLENGVLQDSLADIQAVVTILVLVFVLWTAVPAIGALGLGFWLRREIGRSADGSTQLVA